MRLADKIKRRQLQLWWTGRALGVDRLKWNRCLNAYKTSQTNPNTTIWTILRPFWILSLLSSIYINSNRSRYGRLGAGEAGSADLGPYPTPVWVPTTRENTGGEAGATSCKYWTTTRWRFASMQQVIFHLFWCFTGAIQNKLLAYNIGDQHCVIVYTLQIVWFIWWEIWVSVCTICKGSLRSPRKSELKIYCNYRMFATGY